jgi:hypothetical protein
MSKFKGPAIFLAKFLRDNPPFDGLENIGPWVAGLGYTRNTSFLRCTTACAGCSSFTARLSPVTRVQFW